MSEDLTRPRTYGPDFVSTLYQKELDVAFAPVMERLRDEVAVRLVRAAVASAAHPAAFERALEQLIDYVYGAADPTVLPRETVAPLVERIVRVVAGQDPPKPPKVRLGRLPSIRGHVVFLVESEADAESVREAIRPGQIWVAALELDDGGWQTVGGVVQTMRRHLGQPFGHPGRPKGSPNKVRDEVARRVACENSNHAAWDIVVAAGLGKGPLWDPKDPKAYGRNKSLLDRLRTRGRQILG